MKQIVFILIFAMLLSPSLLAQHDVATAGGGGKSANGSIDFTIGQVASFYLRGEDLSASSGVQQAFCTATVDTILHAVCQGQPFEWQEYRLVGSDTRIAGLLFRTHHDVSWLGCDSASVLRLNVMSADTTTLPQNVCDTFVWHNKPYTLSTTLYDTLANIFGCDSVVIVPLTIRHSTDTTIVEQAYMAFDWFGQSYTQSGSYLHTLTNSRNCDSNITLSLSVIAEQIMPQIVCYNRQLLTVDHNADPNGAFYHAYRWYCNDTLIAGATNDVYFRYTNERYEKLQGCYYVEVPTDSTLRFWVRSNTICLGANGIEQIATPVMQLYPNPARAGATLKVELQNIDHVASYTLYDARGSVITSKQTIEPSFELTAPAVAGTYILAIATQQSGTLVGRIVVR